MVHSQLGVTTTLVPRNRRNATLRVQILKMAMKNIPSWEIAEKVGMEHRLVVAMIDRVLKYAAPAKKLRKTRNRHVRLCEEMVTAALREYVKSGEDEVTITKEEIPDKEGGVVQKTTTRRRGQCKNPSYLKVALEASKRIADMLGMDQPKQVAVKNDNRTLQIVEVVVNRQDVTELKKAGLIAQE